MTILLEWDKSGQRTYETGVDRGVLYLPNSENEGAYDTGHVWNGLISVTESPSGAESNKQYADNIVYLNLLSAEEFGGTIEAFTYPDKFAICDGTAEPEAGLYVGQQTRSAFGLSYRTKIGTDLNPELGYKLHLVWNALAAPTEKAYNTINDSPEALTFSWEFSTTPLPISGYPLLRPTASITIDSTKVDAQDLKDLEAILYGTAAIEGETPTPAVQPALPLPGAVIAHFEGVGG